MNTLVIAHRGASSLAKHENTLEAFQIAIDLGANMAELDIRKTLDNKLIVFHNPSINDIPIGSLTYKELCDITIKEGYTVPLYIQVLRLCQNKIKLDIEIKEYGYEKSIVNLTKKYFDYKDYFMKSFIDKAVAKIKSIDSNITAGLLIGTTNHSLYNRLNEYYPVRRLRLCKADFVSPHYKFVTRDFIKRMHFHHYPVYSWTVNTPEIMAKLLSKKVDGIISDRPDIAIQLRNGFAIKQSKKHYIRKDASI